MARDKSKDDTFFNCSQEHEKKYVSGLYGVNSQTVYAFLEKKCADETIKYMTHSAVYKLIEKELGFSVPV